ncbi:hypothetical protein V6N13_004304 [Hibiscus sabdariffa]
MVGGFLWAVYFYPDGKSPEDNATYVSLFVALASEGIDGSGIGYKRFFERTQLEQSDYLKDDCLSVHRSVGVKSHTEGPKIYSIAVPPSNINQHFGKLLESERGTDVSFEVDGEVFPAHKLVLATRSPVFWAQLFGPMKDQYTKQIKIEDIEAPVFKAVLHFMYWDSLPDMQELTDRYGLDRLRLLCEANLCEDVTVNTVTTTLALAEQHHCFQLKAVCLNFVAMPENLRAVMQTDGFEYLKESCPSVMTELLEHVARVNEHSVIISRHGNEAILDRSDAIGFFFLSFPFWSTARARMKIESGAWTRSAMDVDLNLLAVSAMVVEAANEVAALGPFHRERIVAGIVGGYRLCSIAYFEIPFRHFPHVVNRDGK